MRRFFRSEYLPIILLVVVNIVAGFLIVGDYGASWDEPITYQYSQHTLQAYDNLSHRQPIENFVEEHLDYYGPFIFIVAGLITQIAKSIAPNLSLITIWHSVYFIVFQAGVLSLYFLSRRWVSNWSSFGIALLFCTQPLLWGHAFINPKDIPLMSFFTISVLSGLRMLDIFKIKGFDIKNLLLTPQFYFAGILLGATMSIRIIGFAAGIIVLLHLVFMNFRKALRFSYVYFGLAFIIMFLTWPYLWQSPIMNFLEGMSGTIKFVWSGYALFNGVYYLSDQLPRTYTPQLFVMQLTETAVVLFFSGLIILLLPNSRKRYKDLLILIIPWFILPAIYITAFGVMQFDNLRHFLFLYPAAFLIMAVGLEYIFTRTEKVWLKTLITIIVVFPGLVGIIQYHPYEYTYYNHVTSSTTTIFRNYETDYWMTSYKQIASWLNKNAPQNARVLVWGPEKIIQYYIRSDIQLERFEDLYGFQNVDLKTLRTNLNLSPEAYYIVLPSRYDVDLHILPDSDPVYSVTLRSVVLATIKYINPQDATAEVTR